MTDTKRKFGGLPGVPQFEQVADCYEAVTRLFRGEAENIYEIKALGGEIYKAYVALFNSKKCFIKVIREDNPYSKDMYYEYEWELKKNREQSDRLALVDAELVYPDNGAIFYIDNYQHYMTSYEYVPGETLAHIFQDYVGTSRFFPAFCKKKKLLHSFARYGQVMALLHFRQDEPDESIHNLLKRPVQLMLSDRNGYNELYDKSRDRIYLIDLAEERTDDKPWTVENELGHWTDNLTYLFIDAHKQNKIYTDNATGLFCDLVNIFINGYASSLPDYNAMTLKSMIIDALLNVIQRHSEKEPWLRNISALISISI